MRTHVGLSTKELVKIDADFFFRISVPSMTSCYPTKSPYSFVSVTFVEHLQARLTETDYIQQELHCVNTSIPNHRVAEMLLSIKSSNILISGKDSFVKLVFQQVRSAFHSL